MALLAVRRGGIRDVRGSWTSGHATRLLLGGIAAVGSDAGELAAFLDYTHLRGVGDVLRFSVLFVEHLYDDGDGT